MGERIETVDYSQKLRAVYFPLANALAENINSVRIGPQYEVMDSQVDGIVFTPYFLAPPLHPNPTSNDAFKFFVVASRGNELLGHRITDLHDYGETTSASDKGRAVKNGNYDVAVAIELTHLHILKTLAQMRARTIFYTYATTTYGIIGPQIGLDPEVGKSFNPFDQKGYLKTPYARTFDEMEEVMLAPIAEPVTYETEIKLKAKRLSKSTRIPELCLHKTKRLIDETLPLMRATIGIQA